MRQREREREREREGEKERESKRGSTHLGEQVEQLRGRAVKRLLPPPLETAETAIGGGTCPATAAALAAVERNVPEEIGRLALVPSL